MTLYLIIIYCIYIKMRRKSQEVFFFFLFVLLFFFLGSTRFLSHNYNVGRLLSYPYSHFISTSRCFFNKRMRCRLLDQCVSLINKSIYIIYMFLATKIRSTTTIIFYTRSCLTILGYIPGNV